MLVSRCTLSYHSNDKTRAIVFENVVSNVMVEKENGEINYLNVPLIARINISMLRGAS